MFGKKNKSSSGGAGDSPWGNTSAGGDDFWSGSSAPPDAPPSQQQSPSFSPTAAVEPPRQGAPQNLLELIQPVFLFICEKHRIVRDNRDLNYSSLKSDCDRLLSDLESRARMSPVIQQQLEKIKDPLLWYIDYWFGSSGAFRDVKDEWNRNRLGNYPIGDDDGSLAGDEAFFDELENELAEKSEDNLANERLVFYYIAIGLGFTGVYFKDVPEHHAALRKYMEKIYIRVRHYIDANPGAKVTPDCYDYTDKRDFVAPARDRPMILVAALLCLLGTFGVGYFYLYGEQKKDLEQVVENVQQTDNRETGTE